MRCDEIAPYLEDLLDGEPDEAAALALDHIAECPECRHRLDWLAASREAFRSLPPERPRNGFDRRLAERIAVETGVEMLPDRDEPWRRPLPAWLRRPAVQWAVAASLLLAVLSGSLVFKSGPFSGPLLPAGEQVAEERPAAPAPEIRRSPALPATPAAPAPASPREESAREEGMRAEPRPVELRASRGNAVRPVRPVAPAEPLSPAPEYLEEDRMAGLDVPPMLGYVQAQDLPVSFRCQLDSTQEGCGLRGAGAAEAGPIECEGFGECSGDSHADWIAAADLTEAASMD
jgi:hypothetical protein